MSLSISILMRTHILFDLAIIPEHDGLDDAAYEFLRPHAEQNTLRSSACLGSWIGASVQRRSQHIVHPVRVEHKCRIGYIEFASCLRQRETLFQYTEYGLGHGFGSPRFQRTTLAKAQLLHQILLIRIPAFLPHGLQLILVAVCWKWGAKDERETYSKLSFACYANWLNRKRAAFLILS